MIYVHKKLLFPTFVIILFVTIGCNSSDSKKNTDVNLFIGLEGLSLEFVKNAPPPRAFEQSDFPILLRIKNKGANSITNNYALLTIGSEKDYISSVIFDESGQALKRNKDNEAKFAIEGKTQINPKGDEIIASFNAKTGKLDSQSETRISTITANLCYPYKTTLSMTACIDPDVAGIRPGKKVCAVKEQVFNNGQGAPIAITKIEPQMIPEGENINPQLLIFIENKGKGIPINKENYLYVCGKSDLVNSNSPDNYNKKTKIWNVAVVRAFGPGRGDENQLTCCPNINGECKESTNGDEITGFLKFQDKKDFVRCTLKNSKNPISRNSNAFTSPIRIEIEYGYVQTISADVIIQKPLKY